MTSKKNILITVIIAIVLVIGALVWIWNSEIGQPVLTENAPTPQPQSQSINSNAAINSALNDVQITDPGGDFESVDSAMTNL